MQPVCFFIVVLSACSCVFGDRHNEQQIGENNYEADLEDISFLVFYDGVPGDYDYSYDYSDLTVKPEDNDSTSDATTEKLTTQSPTTSTVKPEVTKNPNLTLAHPLNTENFQIPVVVVTEGAKLKKGYVSSSTLRKKPDVETESLPKRTCLNGFVLDEKNRCKKVIRKSQMNARSPKPPLPNGLRYPQRPQPLKESK